jgi:hypothetical protein
MVNRSVVVTSGTTTQVKKVVVGKPVRRVSAGQFRLNILGDVDVTSLENGSMLVYKISTQKWTSTKDIDDGQNLNGGSY